MFVKPCPKCGRTPKIEECVSFKDIRRRLCGCPNYCSVLSTKTKDVDFVSVGLNYTFAFIYHGDGDDNTIFRIWNELLKEEKR